MSDSSHIFPSHSFSKRSLMRENAAKAFIRGLLKPEELCCLLSVCFNVDENSSVSVRFLMVYCEIFVAF